MVGITIPEQPEQKPWCGSWWHNFWYGQTTRVQEHKNWKTVEFFCKKCGLKTGGYNHFKTTIVVK